MGMAAQGEKGWDELLRQMVEARQLSALDAQRLKKEASRVRQRAGPIRGVCAPLDSTTVRFTVPQH